MITWNPLSGTYENLSADSDPDETADASQGFRPGAQWITATDCHVCIDASIGAAKWLSQANGTLNGEATPLFDPTTDGTFTRASDGTYQTSASTLAVASTNARRMEDRGDGVSMLLIERQHVNQLPNNRDLTAGTWGGAAGGVTANAAVGPDGETKADRMTLASGALGRFDSMAVSEGIFSQWAKSVSGDQTIQMWIGGTNGPLIRQTVSETWTRVHVPEVPTSPISLVPLEGRTTTGPNPDAIAQAQDFYLDFIAYTTASGMDGAKYPLSPIETAGVAVTVQPDSLDFSGGTWPDAIATGVSTWRIRPLWGRGDLVSTNVRWLFSIGGSSDGIRATHDGTSVLFEMLDGGVVVAESLYLLHDALDDLYVTSDASTGRITVNGVPGELGTAPTWSAASALRVGGIQGAAAGSGQEIDAGLVSVISGDSTQPFAVSMLSLGDSITAGGSASSGNGYQKLLSDDLDGVVAFQNTGPYFIGSAAYYGQRRHSGVSGNTIAQMTARIATDVTPFGANVITIHAGTNDMPTGAAGALTNMTALLDALYAAVPDTGYVIVCEIPERVSYTTETAAFNAGLAAAIAASDWPTAKITKVAPGVVLADLVDGVHPGDVGHQKIATAIDTAIQSWIP